MTKKILVSTTSFGVYDQAPLNILTENGFEIVRNTNNRILTSEEVVILAKDCLGLIAGTEKLNGVTLKQLPILKVVSRCGVGMDNVDLAVASELGIKILNTPLGPTRAVAELTVGLVLSLLRSINQQDKELKNGRWKKRMGFLLQGKKIGIIGFGRIGQSVADLLFSFGTEIIFYDPIIGDCQNKYRAVSLKDLLKFSDIISLHLNYKGEKSFIGLDEIRQMKPGVFIVNCARGRALDEEALLQALKDGKLAGAALDVFEKEPYVGPLSEFDNVILTPHIGSYAREARIQMEIDAVNNLIAGLWEKED